MNPDNKPSLPSSEGRSSRLIAGLLVAAACGNSLYLWGWTIDDPWILYRYAENLVAGHGLVFNPGERLEAFSSFTYVALLAAFQVLGLNLDFFCRLTGLLSHLAAVGLLLFAGRGFHPERPAVFRSISAVLLAFSVPAAAWAVGGLETNFQGLALLATLVLYQREETRGRGFRWSALLLLVVSLTRSEGALVFFCLAAHQLTKWLWGGRRIDRRDTLWFVIFVVFYGCYTAFRWVYFGSLMPNTYYAKAAGPVGQQLLKGLGYSLRFAVYGGVVPYVLCLAPLFSSETRQRALPWLFVLVGYWAFIVYCGGDWMPFYRFFVPILPVIYWLLQEGCWVVYSRRRDSPEAGRRRSQGSLLVGVAVLVLLAGNLALMVREVSPILGRARRGTLIGQFFEVGQYLKEHGNPSHLLAGEEAGVIPYVSGMRFLDIMGIVDAHIARRPGGLHMKSDPDYVILERAPDWIVLHAFSQQHEGWWAGFYPSSQAILQHPEFRRRYTLAETFVHGDDLAPGKNLFLVFRKVSAQ